MKGVDNVETFNPTRKYGHVRGFNFQPDWSSHGIGIWLNFDGRRYRELIVRGKELFPAMNALRIWLSFDAWCEDPRRYLGNIREAARIIEQEGLKFIPVYFNGWFGIPVFGGFVPEHLSWSKKTDDYACFRLYLRETLEALSSDAILLHDVSNEPFNNAWGLRERTETILDFLGEMCSELRRWNDKPITVGSQGNARGDTMGIPQIQSKWGDIDLLSQMVDVITLHPYCIPPMTAAEHWQSLVEVVDYIKGLGKPVIITECCWAGKTDDERIPFLETELSHYNKLGIGFLAHALSDSPVADLHPLDDNRSLGCIGLYMAFINSSGEMRKGHEIFNCF